MNTTRKQGNKLGNKLPAHFPAKRSTKAKAKAPRIQGNRIVSAIAKPKESDKPFSGSNLIPDRYCNVFIIAQKNSG